MTGMSVTMMMGRIMITKTFPCHHCNNRYQATMSAEDYDALCAREWWDPTDFTCPDCLKAESDANTIREED